jgi:hypothetical protein
VGGCAVVYRATELRIEVNWRRRGVMEIEAHVRIEGRR